MLSDTDIYDNHKTIPAINSNESLVSIVIITYNSGKFVIETLESAKAQTYQNIELIISDDCSNDNTVAICKSWIDKNLLRFNRSLIIEASQNKGIAPNCNRGLEAAKGDWIKFIAGDDILADNCIADNIEYVHNNFKAELIFSKITVFGEPAYLLSSEDLKRMKKKLQLPAKQQYINLLKWNYIYAPSYFIKRTKLLDIGGFDERFPMMEDYPLWIKFSSNGDRMHYFDKLTVFKRAHENNSTPKTINCLQNFKKQVLFKELHRNRLYLYLVYHKINFILYTKKDSRYYFLYKTLKLFSPLEFLFMIKNAFLTMKLFLQRTF